MDLSGHEGGIPIPIPISSSYGGGHGQGLGQIHDSPIHHPNGPHSLSTTTTEDHHHHSIIPYSSKKGVVVRYRECLKNHAASIGGSATDGCGEFMPSGDEGTLEALKCSACSCHRNFHRKEIEGGDTDNPNPSPSCDCYHQKGVLISGPKAFGFIHRHHHPPPLNPMIMPIGALQASESDEMEGGIMCRPPIVKKRFRTKFTQEQKEKMMAFAEKVGWRLQRQEEGVVQQFCQEIGVKRRVLKVWMHNNKHNLAKKLEQEQPPQLD